MNNCFNCSGEIKDYYRINSKEYCSVSCIYENSDKQKRIDEAAKIEINNKAEQKTQKQKGLQSKKSKQKKIKR